MKRAVALLPFLAGCAQVLGYDEYRERPASVVTGDSSVPDTVVVDADTAVVDAAPGPARVPTRPPGEIKASGKGRTLWIAAKRMYVGSQTALGMTSTNAWRDWGFDLDKICTSVEDSVANRGTCLRHPEANQQVLVDGDLCRDNNFGHHVIALLVISSEGFETRINDGLREGNNTWVIRIDDVDDGADDTYAPARFYRGASTKPAVPKWDGTDTRKVTADSVVDRDLDRPLVEFRNGYIRDNVWVSGEPSSGLLVLPFSAELNLTMTSTVVTLALDADHKNATRGVLGGAMPMSTLESLLRPIALSSGFCPGTPLYDSLFKTISRFPDVVVGAKDLQSTTVPCDGMSIGIGFDVQSIQPATEIVDPPPPDPSKCGDAGVDGG